LAQGRWNSDDTKDTKEAENAENTKDTKDTKGAENAENKRLCGLGDLRGLNNADLVNGG
jgi:hypothetical protein